MSLGSVVFGRMRRGATVYIIDHLCKIVYIYLYVNGCLVYVQVPREVKDNDVRLLARYRLTEVILASAQPGMYQDKGTCRLKEWGREKRGWAACAFSPPFQRPHRRPDSDGLSNRHRFAASDAATYMLDTSLSFV